MPGAADAPAGSSIFGGGVSVPSRPIPRRPARESRGGPRPREERLPSRRLAAVRDLSHMTRDLRWIALTSAASVALVLIVWVTLRL